MRAPPAASCASTPGCASTCPRSGRRTSSTRAGSRRARAACTATRSTCSGASSRRSRRRTSRSPATASSGSTASPRPGHASHHVCYLHSDGTLYAGDAAGVRIQPARHVLPVSPPPDVDVEGWFRTFEEIERRRPERLALIHFGVAESPSEHLALVRAELERWASREELDQDAWIAAARKPLVAAVGEDEAGHWERAAPLWQSYVGMRRYWDKRAESA